jgi:hypothetical protein
MNDDKNKTDTPAEPVTKQDRKEYMAQYYAENKDEIAERRKAARIARQEEINAAERERYATDPAAREQRLKTNAKGRKTYKERVETDPEAKKKHEERLAKRRERHKERLATDPEYQKQREKFTKELREKRQKENKGDEPP